MSDKDKLITALHTIQKYCEDINDTSECIFSEFSNDSYCEKCWLQRLYPANWDRIISIKCLKG